MKKKFEDHPLPSSLSLTKLYEDRKFNIRQVAAKLGISEAAVWKGLYRHSIPGRTPTDAKHIERIAILEKLYGIEGETAEVIGSKLGITRQAVLSGIRIFRVQKGSRVDKATLERLYVQEQKSIKEVSKLMRISEDSVNAHITAYDLPRRPKWQRRSRFDVLDQLTVGCSIELSLGLRSTDYKWIYKAATKKKIKIQVKKVRENLIRVTRIG